MAASTWAQAHGLAPEAFTMQHYNSFSSPAEVFSDSSYIIADSNKHPNFWHLNVLVLSAVLEVVCVSLPGYIIARRGMFDADAQKFLANLNIMLFTPCLIWTKLASQLSPDKLADLVVIPIIFALQTAVSYGGSRIVSRLFRFRRREQYFVTAMGVFGNSNSLPISLIISLAKTLPGLHWDKIPNDNDNEVAARGILYLLIFQQLGQLVRWSWGYHVLLASPDKFNVEEGGTALGIAEDARAAESDYPPYQDEVANTTERRGLLIDVHDEDESSVSSGGETAGTCTGNSLEIPHPRLTEPANSASNGPVFSSSSTTLDELHTHIPKHHKPLGRMTAPVVAVPAADHAEDTESDSMPSAEPKSRKFSAWCSKQFQRARKAVSAAASKAFATLPSSVQSRLGKIGGGAARFLRGLWAFMNPPLWAMLAAILVASVPSLQHLFFTRGTFLNTSVTRAVEQSGGVAVPLILVVLGANLARNTIPASQLSAEDPKLERKLLIASLISRMLLPTLIMAPVLALTAKYVPVSIVDDPVFVVVCFLLTGAPSALQLAQICQLNNVYLGAMTNLLFQSYVIWILPSTLILVVMAIEVVKWAV